MQKCKAWARRYSQCIRCSTTETRHVGKGLCKKCWVLEWNIKHPGRSKQIKRRWYERQGGKAYAKMRREQAHYGGLREVILERDGYRCTKCGSQFQLLVHHLDRQGRGKPSPNNNPANLTTRCRACHIADHRDQLLSGKKFVAASGWAPKYGLDRCRQCQRSDVKHNARGLCVDCYAKAHYQKFA